MTIFFEEDNPPEIMAKIVGMVDGRLEMDVGFQGVAANLELTSLPEIGGQSRHQKF
jgi:hypothetical protein